MTIYTGYSTISRFQHLISEGFTIETKVYGKKMGTTKLMTMLKLALMVKLAQLLKLVLMLVV